MISIEKQKQSVKRSSAECIICHEKEQIMEITEMDFGLTKPKSYKLCVGCVKRFIHKNFPGIKNVPNTADDLESFLEAHANIHTLVVDSIKKGAEIKHVCALGIHEILDTHIYGHAEYKKTLALSIARHLSGDLKENLLVIGPTGSGKTLSVETIARAYDIPVFCCNASTLTPAGYKGSNVEEIGRGLLAAAGGDLHRAEYGIIFLDEFDKVMKTNFAETIVHQLLRLMEKDYIKVENGNGTAPTMLCTENILFILGGTFSDIKNKKSITLSGKGSDNGDIIKGLKECYNISEEFLGRISAVVELDKFEESDFHRMLKEQPRVALPEIYRFMNKHNADLVLSDCYIKHVSKRAIELGLGVRGLKNLVKEELREVFWEPERIKGSKVILRHEASNQKETARGHLRMVA